jgi:hypothetical protein
MAVQTFGLNQENNSIATYLVWSKAYETSASTGISQWLCFTCSLFHQVWRCWHTVADGLLQMFLCMHAAVGTGC